MLSHFRILFLFFCIFVSFFNPLWGSEEALSPRPFYGFWEIQEKSGETCFLNIKPGGRVSCFWSGNRSSQLLKGHYILGGKGLLIEWPGGYHYLIEKKTENTILRHSYSAGRSLEEAPEESLYGKRYDRRMVGMLVEEQKNVDDTAGKAKPSVAENADEGNDDVAGTDQDDKHVSPVLPPDSKAKSRVNETAFSGQRFAGYWKIIAKDSFWSLMGEKDYFVKITRDGIIEGAPGNLDRFLAGRWKLKGDVVHVLWSDRTYSELTPLEENQLELALFAKDRKEVKSRFKMVRLSLDEGSRFFKAGAAKALGIQDVLGAWLKYPPEEYSFTYIAIERWGKATWVGGDDAILLEGIWSVADDTLKIEWNDGRVSSLVLGPDGFVQSNYLNQDSFVQQLPKDSFPVTRIPADKVGSLREKMKQFYR